MTHLTRFAGLFLCLIGCLAFAQVPQSFSYQAVCRNTNGAPLLNQPIHFNIELLQGSITGTVVYAETQRDTTSAFGVSMLEIGRGTPTTGTFAGINWANTPTFIRISFDATGGNNFISLGTHELLSVPYALYSGNGLPNGTAPNELLYWNGSAWVQLAPGNSGESLTLCGNTLTWATGGICPGLVTSLGCTSAIISGALSSGVSATGVSFSIPYTGGNGGPYNGQSVTSTGVTGLTATLISGNFLVGNGTLNYILTGTPSSTGMASFQINIGGASCVISFPVSNLWPGGTVFCSSSTGINDVLNPVTNKTWMDRNLGASQVAVSSADVNSFGDLYQWGRLGDGHQCRNSSISNILSSSDIPGNSNFIVPPFPPTNNYDWRLNQNPNLWQGINGINNPCPNGYRVPTSAEINSERNSWTTNNSAGAFSSPLKFSLGGIRSSNDGSIGDDGLNGYYWVSDINTTNSMYLIISNNSMISATVRAEGCSIRCIKN